MSFRIWESGTMIKKQKVQQQEYLGLEIDTVDGVIRIPSDELEQVKKQLLLFINSKKVTLKFVFNH